MWNECCKMISWRWFWSISLIFVGFCLPSRSIARYVMDPQNLLNLFGRWMGFGWVWMYPQNFQDGIQSHGGLVQMIFLSNWMIFLGGFQPLIFQGVCFRTFTWKWMVGRRSFPFGMAYFQGRTVSFRECNAKPIGPYWSLHFETQPFHRRRTIEHFGERLPHTPTMGDCSSYLRSPLQ